jgi:hypothetical protein
MASPLMRGVFVFRVEGDVIQSGRMFFEVVDASTADANEAVRQTLETRTG